MKPNGAPPPEGPQTFPFPAWKPQREITMFFDDPDFMDHACKLVCTSTLALNKIQAEDFKIRAGVAGGRERAAVAEAAFEHFAKHAKPAGCGGPQG